MADSLAIQQTVQTVSNVGTQFIPAPWNLFGPAITSIVTIITGAIIRSIERGKMKRRHKKEIDELKSKLNP